MRRWAVIAVAAVATVACGGTSPGEQTTGSTIVLGAPLGLTGSLTKESTLTKQGYDLWLDWINAKGGIVVNNVKHPVTIKYYDDTSNANQSAVLMQKLITEDKANFLLGPYGSAATATDAAIAEQNAIAINKAAKEQKLNAKLFAYSVGPSTPDFIAALGKDANFVFDGSQWTPQVKYTPAFYLTVAQYVAAYKAKYPGLGDPDYHVAESTAACLALERAIENAGSLDPKKVRDALAGLDVTVFFGQVKFDARGINIYKPMVVEQIQDGVHHTVYPQDIADAKPMYPTPAWDQR